MRVCSRVRSEDFNRWRERAVCCLVFHCDFQPVVWLGSMVNNSAINRERDYPLFQPKPLRSPWMQTTRFEHRLSREENRGQRSVNHANRQVIIHAVFLPRGVDEHVVITSLRVTRASIPYTAVVHLHEADLSGSSAFIQCHPIPNGSNQNSRHIVVHRMQDSLHRSRAGNSRGDQDA